MARAVAAACVIVMLTSVASGQQAGPAPAAPAASADRAIDLLWRADLPGFRRFVEANPEAVQRRGPGGATLLMYAALYADADTIAWLLQRGADPNGRDESQATALMWAVDDLEIVRVLLAAGAEADARSALGLSAAMIASGQPGSAASARLLLDRGSAKAAAPDRRPSCTRTSAAAGRAPEAAPAAAAAWRDRVLQGVAPGDGPAAVAEVLLALHSQQHPRDLATDAMVRYLRTTQQLDGRWIPALRSTSCRSDIAQTTLALRAMQLYSPPQFSASRDQAVVRALRWLTQQKGGSSEDRAFRLLGLIWAGATKYGVAAAKRSLLDAQRDGGEWPQGAETVATTRLALAALGEAGVMPEEPPYKQAMRFLTASDRDGAVVVAPMLLAALQPRER
jgi:hypothetical protein